MVKTAHAHASTGSKLQELSPCDDVICMVFQLLGYSLGRSNDFKLNCYSRISSCSFHFHISWYYYILLFLRQFQGSKMKQLYSISGLCLIQQMLQEEEEAMEIKRKLGIILGVVYVVLGVFVFASTITLAIYTDLQTRG